VGLGLDVTKWAGQVRVRSIGFAGQLGHGSKWVIFKRANRVVSQSGYLLGRVELTRIFQTSFFFFFFNYKNKSMTTCLKRMNKINGNLFRKNE